MKKFLLMLIAVFSVTFSAKAEWQACVQSYYGYGTVTYLYNLETGQATAATIGAGGTVQTWQLSAQQADYICKNHNNGLQEAGDGPGGINPKGVGFLDLPINDIDDVIVSVNPSLKDIQSLIDKKLEKRNIISKEEYSEVFGDNGYCESTTIEPDGTTTTYRYAYAEQPDGSYIGTVTYCDSNGCSTNYNIGKLAKYACAVIAGPAEK